MARLSANELVMQGLLLLKNNVELTLQKLKYLRILCEYILMQRRPLTLSNALSSDRVDMSFGELINMYSNDELVILMQRRPLTLSNANVELPL
jgi:hypothetical protein